MAHGNARAGKHKARYDRYKNQGRLEKNKEKKQQRHEKRLAKLTSRETVKHKKTDQELLIRSLDEQEKYRAKIKDPAYLESVFRKLDNAIAAEQKAEKDRVRLKSRKDRKNGKQVQKAG